MRDTGNEQCIRNIPHLHHNQGPPAPHRIVPTETTGQSSGSTRLWGTSTPPSAGPPKRPRFFTSSSSTLWPSQGSTNNQHGTQRQPWHEPDSRPTSGSEPTLENGQDTGGNETVQDYTRHRTQTDTGWPSRPTCVRHPDDRASSESDGPDSIEAEHQHQRQGIVDDPPDGEEEEDTERELMTHQLISNIMNETAIQVAEDVAAAMYNEFIRRYNELVPGSSLQSHPLRPGTFRLPTTLAGNNHCTSGYVPGRQARETIATLIRAIATCLQGCQWDGMDFATVHNSQSVDPRTDRNRDPTPDNGHDQASLLQQKESTTQQCHSDVDTHAPKNRADHSSLLQHKGSPFRWRWTTSTFYYADSEDTVPGTRCFLGQFLTTQHHRQLQNDYYMSEYYATHHSQDDANATGQAEEDCYSTDYYTCYQEGTSLMQASPNRPKHKHTLRPSRAMAATEPRPECQPAPPQAKSTTSPWPRDWRERSRTPNMDYKRRNDRDDLSKGKEEFQMRH